MRQSQTAPTVLVRLAALGPLIPALLLYLAPAHGQNLDQRSTPLQQDTLELKKQQSEITTQSNGTAEAMPAFTYRPGGGLMIEAADKSWAFRASLEAYFRMLFLNGRDQVGRTNGEIINRQFKPYFFYCVINCLWEFETALDLDGFGNGSGKNPNNTAPGSILHRAVLHFHAEKLHPWFPTIDLGADLPTTVSISRQGSIWSGTQAELDLTSRFIGPNLGATNGVVLNWDDRSLAGVGVPGRIGRFQISIGISAKATMA